MPTVTKAARIRWTAAKDGIAHAHRGRAPRAVCGAPAIDERYAWTTTSRCGACTAALEGER